MFKLFLVASVILSTSLMAEIKDSTLIPRHTEMIEKAIDAKCVVGGRRSMVMLNSSVNYFALEQDSHLETYTTQIELTEKLDQIFDVFLVTVTSEIVSGYTQHAHEWKITITDVNCGK